MALDTIGNCYSDNNIHGGKVISFALPHINLLKKKKINEPITIDHVIKNPKVYNVNNQIKEYKQPIVLNNKPVENQIKKQPLKIINPVKKITSNNVSSNNQIQVKNQPLKIINPVKKQSLNEVNKPTVDIKNQPLKIVNPIKNIKPVNINQNTNSISPPVSIPNNQVENIHENIITKNITINKSESKPSISKNGVLGLILIGLLGVFLI